MVFDVQRDYMTSWRESDDPRCPACGEKITATADYCMHCEADFAEDGSIISGPDDAPTDDFSYAGGTAGGGSADSGGTVPDTGGPTPDTGGSSGVEPDVGDSPDPAWKSDDSADATDSDDYDTSADPEGPPEVGQSTGTTTEPTGSGEFEKTSLLLRGPVCVIMGFPAGLMVLAAVGLALATLPGNVAAAAFLVGWIGTTVYLLKKPLASDAIGDGFYVYAVLLIALPIVIGAGMAVRSLLGLSQDTLGEAIGVGIGMGVFFMFPAVFFLLLGYGANYYARQQIEDALNEQGRTA